jgi:hypothetical protein
VSEDEKAELVRLLVESSESLKESSRLRGRSPEEVVELIAFLLSRRRPGPVVMDRHPWSGRN